jgi:hypothetical protein
MEGLFWSAADLFTLTLEGRRFLGFHIKPIRAQTESKRPLPYLSRDKGYTTSWCEREGLELSPPTSKTKGVR